MNPTLQNPNTGVTATPTANTTPAQYAAAGAQGFSPIPADSLTGKSSQPITVPQAAPYVSPTHAVTAPQGQTVNADGTVTQPPPVKDDAATPSIKDRLLGIFNKEATKGDVQTQLENDANISNLTAQKNSDYNAYIQAKADQTNQIEAMRHESGGTTAGNAERVAEFQRTTDAHISNLAIQSNISQGNLTAAQDSVTKKLDAQFSPLTEQANILSALSSMENNDLTDSQKIAMQNKADQLKTDTADVRKTADALHKTLLQNNAPASVYDAIDKAANGFATGKITADEANTQMMKAAGKYGVDAKATLDGDLARAQIEKLNAETAALKDPQNNPKIQQTLEQQARTLLHTEMSNRSGSLGIQAAKVDQGIHLMALVNQYKQADGTYNIPQSQYSELVMGLANLVSGTNSVSDASRDAIMQKTAAGDIKGALTYITGTPFNGTTQDVIKNLVDSIQRQGTVAENLRDQYVKRLEGEMPTDLNPDRKAALLKDELPSFSDAVNGNVKISTSNTKISGLAVTLPNGQVWNAPDQKTLEAFKKDNGL